MTEIEDIQELENVKVDVAKVKATYQNVRKILYWIAKSRNEENDKRKTLFHRLQFLSEGTKQWVRVQERMEKADANYHMLGMAWLEALGGAVELGYLDRLKKDAKLNAQVERSTVTDPRPDKSLKRQEDRSEKIRELAEQVKLASNVVTKVSGLSEHSSPDVGSEEGGETGVVSDTV